VTHPHRGGRPRPVRRSGAFFVGSLMFVAVAALILPAPVPAQVPDTLPAQADTVPPPRLPAPTDTVPPDTVPPEPPPPPPALPALDPIGPTGWSVAAWEWQRADLLRLPDLSLLHLLERIPGLTPVRVTSVGQPEAAAVFGATAGAIRYEVDGFALDPLTTPTFDPSRLPLVALESVRIERRLTGVTVRIRTAAPVEPRAYSVVEAATGDFRTNLFRGTFMAPRVLAGSLALGFESLGTGFPVGGTNLIGGSLKWTWARDETGIQLEYRQSDMDREGVAGGLVGARRDLVVRARSRFGPVAAEAYAGSSSVEDELAEIVVRESTAQGGLRLRAATQGALPVEATASLRLRSHPRLPAQELELAGWAYPAAWFALGTEAVHSRWEERSATNRLAVTGRAGPFLGLTATASIFRDDQVLPTATPDPAPLESAAAGPVLERDGARAGLEVQWGGLQLAAAAVRITGSPVPGFGLAFDDTAPDAPGGEATGVEAAVTLPTLWAPLRLEGWYVDMDLPPAWPYFPAEQWRAALVYHHLPLPSGNLELYARAEHQVRGAMLVPGPDGLDRVDAYRSTNLELTIRVVSVRAFLRWHNMLNRPFQQDLVGFQRPGQHIVYGVKWEFWN
jgi:hypothetical protein